MSEPTQSRSGCGLVLGVLLIGTGCVFLASNLFGLSLVGVWAQGLRWFSLYWPALLILWGGYKIYQRVTRPESARVSIGEIFLLVFIVLVGLTVSAARHFVANVPVDISLDDLIESIDPEISFGPAHAFTEEHRFEFPADRGLQVDNGSGAITVRGWDEADLKVTLTKRVRRHSVDRAGEIAEGIQMRLDVPPTGPARLAAETPSEEHRQAETDLEIWLPRATPLTVSNRRGPLRVSDLEAPVGLATTNDSIEVRDIEGRVQIDGRRGPVRIERIVGNVEARNRYGGLTAKGIQGDLIGETSNGSVQIEQITGSARITNRHGRIRATEIGKDLTIEATHTEVFVEDVGSAVSIETSYRPVFVRGVTGRVDIEARSSEVEVRDVAGNLDVSNVHRPVVAVGIGGGAVVKARRGEVHLESVSGPIEVENSYHPVEIHGFQSSLTVHSEHSPLRIATEALGGELNLTTSYGEVRLTLPSESSFRLRVRVKGGRIHSDFRREDWEEKKQDEEVVLSGTAAGGASPILIETTYGDVRVLEAGSQ